MADECNSLFSLNTLNSNFATNISIKKPNLHSSSSAILDSGCTGNYLRPDAPVVDQDYTTPPISCRILAVLSTTLSDDKYIDYHTHWQEAWKMYT